MSKIPVYEVPIQVASGSSFVDMRVLTTENPNVILMDWSKDYEPIGYLTTQEVKE